MGWLRDHPVSTMLAGLGLTFLATAAVMVATAGLGWTELLVRVLAGLFSGFVVKALDLVVREKATGKSEQEVSE